MNAATALATEATEYGGRTGLDAPDSCDSLACALAAPRPAASQRLQLDGPALGKAKQVQMSSRMDRRWEWQGIRQLDEPALGKLMEIGRHMVAALCDADQGGLAPVQSASRHAVMAKPVAPRVDRGTAARVCQRTPEMARVLV